MVETPSKADNYRQTASTLRGFAERMNPGDPQIEIIELAERFERLAQHTERLSRTDYEAVGRSLPPSREGSGSG